MSESLLNKTIKKEIDLKYIVFNDEIDELKNLIIKEPKTSKIFIQEKLNANAVAGIRKITRNIKLPKKPI